jgi:hypothetical protein
MEAAVTALFDKATNTVSYIVADPATAKATIVDCVLDFNPKSARTSTCSARPGHFVFPRARGVRAAVPSKSASLRPNTLSMVWTNQSYRKWSKSHFPLPPAGGGEGKKTLTRALPA